MINLKYLKYLKYILLFILPLIFIFSYGKYRCDNKDFKDPLEKKILELDGWSATHFLFFMVVGFIYPDTIILSMIMGILWELFEHYYGVNRPGWLGGYGDCNDLATDKKDGNWWYGKWSDILCNAMGFIIGVLGKNNIN
jgi:hypothetical protein|tara:strand:+ start:253 stop:669 length:417 start_codon:yes stop_codon:yes gene_type:complete